MKNGKDITKNVNIVTKYKEVNLDVDGYDRTWTNPMARVYRYEYAMYKAVSDLFASVVCRSKCVESLKLYFSEMPHTPERDLEAQGIVPEPGKKRKTQEELIAEIASLVKRDVEGKINFPMMQICQAEVRAAAMADGTHIFTFTDGIYGFSIHLDMIRKGRPHRIEVKALRPSAREKKTDTSVEVNKDISGQTAHADEVRRGTAPADGNLTPEGVGEDDTSPGDKSSDRVA